MKLLFDENLSAALPKRLATAFPGSAHLRDVGLKGAADSEIWDYASAHGFVIITKDDDFRERSVLEGAPPKVVMIMAGNCSTFDLERLLQGRASQLEGFATDVLSTLMELR